MKYTKDSLEVILQLTCESLFVLVGINCTIAVVAAVFKSSCDSFCCCCSICDGESCNSRNRRNYSDKEKGQ